MAKTSDSEKSAVMYSPSGYLYYYDLKKNKLKTRLSSLEIMITRKAFIS